MNQVQRSESIYSIVKRLFHYLPALLALCLLSSCDLAKLSANREARELKEKVAQLEKEREEAALEAELEEARRQLAIALSSLDEENLSAGAEPMDLESFGDGQGDLEDFADVPRAIVVEETPRSDEFSAGEENAVALEATAPAALLDTGDHQIFFAELSRFGEWLETRDYGYVWQPTALGVDPAWRPYTRGRWVNSDQGWTWLSDEPFGWAVYHYGRWVLLARHGWVWVPGDDWAPAWVSWRQNDDYLGWAPLPPETLYDEVYDYGPGIDLAYDVSPDYYNFVPVDHFYEPVHSHCVPRATVITVIINTRNVTRFSMRNNHVHCGGPDFGWVNRHVRRPARRCQIDLGIGRDHFAHRHHHRLHEDRLRVFAPRVDAPWNAAVCPGRIARDLGRVEIVRAGKREIKSDLTYRHHEATVRRHESAREALERPECQVALRNNQQRRRDVENRPQGNEDPAAERQRRRVRAEEGLRAATEAVAAAERRMQDRKLQPEERAESRRKIEQAEKELDVVRESLNTRRVGRGTRPESQGDGSASEEAKRRALAQQQAEADERKRQVLAEQKAAEAKRVELAREKAEEEKRRALAQQQAEADERKRQALALKKAEEAKRRALAGQKAAEAKRMELAQQQAEADERKRQALAREKAEEAKRRALAEQKLAEAKRAELAREKAEEERRRVLAERKVAEAKRVELARQQAEEAKRRALAEQKLAEAKRAELAREKAEEERRRVLAERKVAEAKRMELARQQAEEAKRRVLAEQKQVEARRAEMERQQALARQKAEEVQRRALAERKQAEARRADLARQQAAEAKRRALAQQKTEEARRQALARQKMEESRRRAELDARRKAQIDAQRRADADRARVEAKRRSQIEEQRRAAALQSQRQAEAEQAARARAQAQVRAKARAEAQAAARRQNTDAMRREAAKTSRSRKTR